MKKLLMGLSIAAALTLTACSADTDGANPENDAPSEQAAQLDLTGTWTEKNPEASTQVAVIENGTISINWVNETENTEAIYWIGTYPEPETTEDTYDWVSERNTEATDSALLASTADEKDFLYTNGVLSYEVSALGVTRTIELTRE